MKYIARVIPGRGEGRKLGFPTLNLEIPTDFKAEYGIYAGWVWLETSESEALPAAFHYGPVPAFGIQENSLEVHIIDSEVTKPPAALEFEVVQYLRPVADFKDLETLAGQIREDVNRARETLKKV